VDGPSDVLNHIIDEMGRRGSAAAVLGANASRLDDVSRDALEFVGWRAIRGGSAYAKENAPARVAELIRAGKEFRSCHWAGEEFLDKEDRAKLAVIGLVTLASAKQSWIEQRTR